MSNVDGDLVQTVPGPEASDGLVLGHGIVSELPIAELIFQNPGDTDIPIGLF